jgi:hypothetical protein
MKALKTSVLLIILTATFSFGYSQTATPIKLIGASTTSTTTSTSLVINKPSSLAVGDVMIAAVSQSTNNNSVALSDATSTGWTLISGSAFRSNGNDRWWGTALYKIAVAADVAATSFTFSLDSDADDGVGGISAFSGVNNLTPFDVTSSSTLSATDGSISASSITTVTPNSAVLLLGFIANDASISGWSTTSPGSLTELFDVPFNSDLDMGVGMSWAIKPSAGSTGSGVATVSQRTGSVLIALRPALFSSTSISALTTTTSTTTGTSLVIDKPSSLAVGDVMIAAVSQSTNNSSVALSDATSTGWTLISGSAFRSNGNDRWWGTALYKIAVAADVAATSFTFSLDSDADDGVGGISAFSGVDNTNPFDVTSSTSLTATNGFISASSITTVTPNSAVLLLGFIANDASISGWSTTSPGSLTELFDVPFNSDLDMGVGMSWAIMPSAGSTGSGIATVGERTGSVLIALRPANNFSYFNGSYGSTQNVNSRTIASRVSKSIPLSASYFTSSNVKKVSIVFASTSHTVSKIYADKDNNDSLSLSSSGDFELTLNTDYVIENISTGLNKLTINLPVITASGNLYKLFVASTASGTTFMDVLNLAAAALPVTLSSFTAKPTTDNKVSLGWVTAAESVNKGFRIERQAGNDNGKFEQIGFVGSKAKDGNSQNTLYYSFIDAAPKAGTSSFYRLVQEDLDGKLTYTEVRVVKLNGQSVSMVFPNPSNGAVNISRTADGKKMKIQVIDQSGKIISQVNNITDANYRINISQSGVYSIKMMYPETGEQSIQRVVVQK